jgi:DNA-binding transcriptional ArsR family regulator
MSVTAMSAVFKSTLPTGEKMVLLIIADHASDDGTNAWPGLDTIARKASMTRRSVQRHISALVDAGLVIVERQKGGTAEMRDDRRPNRYTVVLDALPVDGVTERTPRKRCAAKADGVTSEHDGVTSEPPRGDRNDADGVTPTSPNPSYEPSEEPPVEFFPDAAHQEPPPITARDITGHYHDTFRQTHGAAPPQTSVKRIAQAAKQLLVEGYDPDAIIEATRRTAKAGHANLAATMTSLLAERSRVSEPKSWSGIREFVERAQ